MNALRHSKRHQSPQHRNGNSSEVSS